MAIQSGDSVSLELPRDFVGQVLDGLDWLIEEWNNTAEYMEHGVSRDDMMIRECNDANEARKIRDFYSTIRDSIEVQMSTAD